VPSPTPAARVTPLSAERYRLQLTMSREAYDLFRHAQALLRHAVPSGNAAVILNRALTLLVDDLEKKRFAETSRPRPDQTARPGSRHVPAAVRREVWRRDGGRCAFVGARSLSRDDISRVSSAYALSGFGAIRAVALAKADHVEPYWVGGPATVDNIQVRCAAHNHYEAQLFF
jgi:hypothetical protein